MKKILLSLVLAAFAFSASAQEVSKEKTRWAGHTTNKFWYNWEISVGAGVGTAVRDMSGSSEGAFGDRLGFEGNISATKWFHPIIGARLQLQGGKFSNYPAGETNGELVKWPYIFVHADAMINLSNWIGGYREDRFYYAVPFIGFGYQAVDFTDSFKEKYGEGYNGAYATVFGLLNKLRVSKQFDINIELKAWLYREGDMPSMVGGDGGFGQSFSATVGFSYRFNKRGWDKAYTQSDLDVYVNEAQKLRDDLAAANAARVAAEEAAAQSKADADRALAKAQAAQKAADEAALRAAKAAEGIHATGNVIFFNYGTSQLTGTDKTRLALIADEIKAGDSKTVYTISGYADAQTGSKAGNKRVSANRAKNVYNYLVSCGVNRDQLKYDSFGGSVAPFPSNQKANRAAIINK